MKRAKLFERLEKNRVHSNLCGHFCVIAGKAVCFGEALLPEFREYAQQIIDNAKVLGETLKREGLRFVTSGTDNHLLLVDLRPFDVTGDVAAIRGEIHALMEAFPVPGNASNYGWFGGGIERQGATF